MEKLMLEISEKMIEICELIDTAKLENNKYNEQKLKERLGNLVFEEMENCPF